MFDVMLIVAAFTLVAIAPMTVRTDLAQKRIPNRVVGLTLAVAGIAALIISLSERSLRIVTVAIIVAAIAGLALGFVIKISPDSIGMGDFKLIVALALLLSLAHPVVFVYAMLATGLIGGVVAAAIVLRGTASAFAYGPVIIAGSLLGVGFSWFAL
jgi:leader peptidase (prepilin peptidase)/N-methyltransferase